MTPASLLSTSVDPSVRLEDLVEREALAELCRNFFSLFGIGVRIYSRSGGLIVDSSSEHDMCGLVNEDTTGRRACSGTVEKVKKTIPEAGVDEIEPCFSGAAYRISAITYEHRSVGRLILGPYLPHGLQEAPETLAEAAPSQSADKLRLALLRMPRAKDETVSRIANHLRAALDLILFSAHKAHLASEMHLVSVRENYRELENKSAQLQVAYDRLRELDRLKSNFLATVSHELRTPLTSIIGYSEMLSGGMAGPLQPEQAQFVETIHEKSEQLLGLIRSLLDLSKLDSGTMHIQRRRVAVLPVLNEVVSTLLPHGRKKGVELKLDVESDLPEVTADPERLRQIMLNLVENAIKFTPMGGTVSVRARVVSTDVPGVEDLGFVLLSGAAPSVEIEVLDTGIGIPAREKKRIFDAFYQVDSSSTREHGGAGLGLSIVKRLVEAHSGTVTVADNAPTGSAFVVRLPTEAVAHE